MKLPKDGSGEGDAQPQASSEDNSPAAGAEGPAPSSTSSTSTPAQEPSAGGRSSQGPGGPSSGNPDVDFSEYLWMENEEEFDSQVLQELEDEEMINYYYELYEASLNENGTWGPTTANLTVSGPPPPFGRGGPQPPPGGGDPVESLTQGLSNRLNLGSSGSGSSRLNPEAAEFVPRTSNMSTPN